MGRAIDDDIDAVVSRIVAARCHGGERHGCAEHGLLARLQGESAKLEYLWPGAAVSLYVMYGVVDQQALRTTRHAFHFKGESHGLTHGHSWE